MFFFKKNRNESNQKQLEKNIENLTARIDMLYHAIEKIHHRQLVETINIEQLTIESPTVDNLTFRLDKLDIEELSGALNLGNNFGTKVEQKQKKDVQRISKTRPSTNIKRTDSDSEYKEEEQRATDKINLAKTENGFSFKVHIDNR